MDLNEEGLRKPYWHPSTVEMGTSRKETLMSAMDPDGPPMPQDVSYRTSATAQGGSPAPFGFDLKELAVFPVAIKSIDCGPWELD